MVSDVSGGIILHNLGTRGMTATLTLTMTSCLFKKRLEEGGACKSKSVLSWPRYCSNDTKRGPYNYVGNIG